MRVEDIMSRDPHYVEESSFLTSARQLVRDYHLRGLPVVNAEGRVKGIITNRDILRVTSTRSNVTVAGFTVDVPLITGEMEVREAARLMTAEKTEMLPVVSSKEEAFLNGVVSVIDIFRSIDPSEIPKKQVRDIMSSKVVTCSQDDPISKVWESMMESDLTGLPVVSKGGRPVGMITRFDILSGPRIGKEGDSGPSDAIHMKTGKLMSTPLYHVGPQDGIDRAIKLMLKHEVGRVTVVEGDKIVGIVDRYDLIRSYLGE